MPIRQRLIALGCLLVAAWFALGAWQTTELHRAAGLITPPGRGVGIRPLSPPQVAHARSLLDAAGLLNPNLQPAILRAELLADAGSPAAARRSLEHLGQSHPRDLAVWAALAGDSPDSPASFRTALRHVRALVPLTPG